MKVVTFGEILLRLASPGYTKLFQKDSLDATFCGSEANVAVSLANFGIDSTFISRLPDSDVGKAARNSLNYFGVKTDGIVLGDGRMGLFYLEKGASQRPSKVVYDRAYSAIAVANKSDFNWEKIFDGATWFHWSGITPALSNELVDILFEACTVAKRIGLTVSCDLNYRAKLWDSDKAKNVMTQLMKFVDVCIGNEEDAKNVLGIENSLKLSENMPKNILQSCYTKIAENIYSQFGCEYVAFSLRRSYSASVNGWSGILYDARRLQSYYSKEYEIQIVDRVGGGDSFAAGLIYALINEKDNQTAIDFAVGSSCLKQTIEGDYNRTTVSDVENLLKSGGNGRVQR